MKEDTRSNVAHTRRGYRFENDWSPEHLEHIAKNYKAGVTIPVNVTIEAEHHVLNMENVRRILRSAHTISVMDCGCRAMYGHCDAPLNVCLDMNEVAERHMAIGWAREITLDEALEVLEEIHEAGLVHTAYGHSECYEPGVINSVCSCCSCCCGTLSGVLRFGLYPHRLTSHATTVTDGSARTDCGVCVDRCQFGAREIADDSLLFNPDLCFGFGLCVSSRPSYAITLVDKQ